MPRYIDNFTEYSALKKMELYIEISMPTEFFLLFKIVSSTLETEVHDQAIDCGNKYFTGKFLFIYQKHLFLDNVFPNVWDIKTQLLPAIAI